MITAYNEERIDTVEVVYTQIVNTLAQQLADLIVLLVVDISTMPDDLRTRLKWRIASLPTMTKSTLSPTANRFWKT